MNSGDRSNSENLNSALKYAEKLLKKGEVPPKKLFDLAQESGNFKAFFNLIEKKFPNHPSIELIKDIEKYGTEEALSRARLKKVGGIIPDKRSARGIENRFNKHVKQIANMVTLIEHGYSEEEAYAISTREKGTEWKIKALSSKAKEILKKASLVGTSIKKVKVNKAKQDVQKAKNAIGKRKKYRVI